VRALATPYGEGSGSDSDDDDKAADDDLDPEAMLQRHAKVLKAMKDRIDALVRDAKKRGSSSSATTGVVS